MKVVQSHGTQDLLLAYAMGTKLRDTLKEAGVDLEFVSFDGAHTVSGSYFRFFIHESLLGSSSSYLYFVAGVTTTYVPTTINRTMFSLWTFYLL